MWFCLILDRSIGYKIKFGWMMSSLLHRHHTLQFQGENEKKNEDLISICRAKKFGKKKIGFFNDVSFKVLSFKLTKSYSTSSIRPGGGRGGKYERNIDIFSLYHTNWFFFLKDELALQIKDGPYFTFFFSPKLIFFSTSLSVQIRFFFLSATIDVL